VLVVDCDPQCNVSSNLGVDVTDTDQPSIRDVFENPDTTLADVVWRSVVDELPGLDLISSTLYLIETEMDLVSRSGREQILGNWVRRNAEALAAYEYVLLDTNPSMGLVNQNVFYVADSIILVTDVGFNSILGAHAFTYLWGKRRADLGLADNVKALIINNSDRRISLSKDLIEYIQGNEELSKLLVLPEIPSRAVLKRTEGVNVPITVYKPNSQAARVVNELVENLKKKGVL